MQAKLYIGLLALFVACLGTSIQAAPVQDINEQQAAAVQVQNEKRAQHANFDLNSYLFTVGTGAVFDSANVALTAVPLEGVRVINP